MHDKPARDRRVQKTRTLLFGALGELIHEKPYDAIAIQEILDRANVGRSTFYTHFRDKDELLLSGIHDMLRPAASTTQGCSLPSERVLRFSLPMFEHIERHRRAGVRVVGARSRATVHGRLERAITESIGAEIGTNGHALGPDRMPPELLIRHVASSFVSVLNWWVDSGSSLSARQANELFRALVLPALTGALD